MPVGERTPRIFSLPPLPSGVELPPMQGALRADLDPLLGLLYGREDVTEVSINGARDLWVKRVGLGWVRVDPGGALLDLKWAELCGTHVASLYGRRFHPDHWPLLGAPLPGGHRLQMVLSGATRTGLVVSIRVRRRKKFGLEDFGLAPRQVFAADPHRQAGSFESGHPVGSREDLVAVVAAGLPVLISGGTDAGKSSFISTLLQVAVPRHKRVGTVEDVAEIDTDGFDNTVGLIAEPSTTGVQIGYPELIKAALRTNLDFICVGEIQADSALPAFRLLNTGHEGFLATLHADSALDGLEAWRTMLAMATGSSAAAGEALGVIARKVARIVQLGPGKRVVEIGRPADLDWRRLLRG